MTGKSGNTYMLHTEPWTAVSTLLCLISSAHRDLHKWRSKQQPKYAEAETLPLGHRFRPYISDTEYTSHGDNARPLDLMCLEGTYSLQRTRSPPGLRLPKSVLWIHITFSSWAGGGRVLCRDIEHPDSVKCKQPKADICYRNGWTVSLA